jgi:hypothetical protein
MFEKNYILIYFFLNICVIILYLIYILIMIKENLYFKKFQKTIPFFILCLK